MSVWGASLSGNKVRFSCSVYCIMCSSLYLCSHDNRKGLSLRGAGSHGNRKGLSLPDITPVIDLLVRNILPPLYAVPTHPERCRDWTRLADRSDCAEWPARS